MLFCHMHAIPTAANIVPYLADVQLSYVISLLFLAPCEFAFCSYGMLNFNECRC
jgi:hypothetical protein